jgi:hypothetical protein
MAEWFKGLFDFRNADERKLDTMLDDYARGGDGHRDTVKGIWLALQASPDLKARMLGVVHDEYLTNFSPEAPGGGAASYNAYRQQVRIPPNFDYRNGDMMGLIFTLGHEIEHARSNRGIHYPSAVLQPSIQGIADAPAPDPGGVRDYTPALRAYVEHTRADEGRAHIGGFNAIASYVHNIESPGRAGMLRALYEACPARMGDFIERQGQAPAHTFALKDGLTIDPDTGRMAYSRENINAMKVYYADHAQLGPERLNYRQDGIRFAWDLVHDAETQAVGEFDPVRREYRIDFGALLADGETISLPRNDGTVLHPPADGAAIVVNDGVELLQLDLSEPLIVEPIIPVPLVPAPLVAEPPVVDAHVAQSSGIQGSEPLHAPLLHDPPLHDPPQSSSVPAPEHPLFRQALALVEQQHGDTPLGEPQERRNLAAALAVAAQQQGMTGIERITPNLDSSGLIVSQGSGESRNNASVALEIGKATPEEASKGRLLVSEPPSLAQGQSQEQRRDPSAQPLTL